MWKIKREALWQTERGAIKMMYAGVYAHKACSA